AVFSNHSCCSDKYPQQRRASAPARMRTRPKAFLRLLGIEMFYLSSSPDRRSGAGTSQRRHIQIPPAGVARSCWRSSAELPEHSSQVALGLAAQELGYLDFPRQKILWEV